ncbi:TonB-dependent receptor [Leeuwenhoekiella parthenopeia]|uniref:TonB-dependent receptor n=1 Tax=Leeuwenhoekiella parthenopeia TaxID=2890320 RepID=A0ABS8GNI9_9FLAO|nr:TonB-dependent receptor [Leeuwenhoekiella parthenopeia]MCC4211557.1 TonB-dependent receptor [Leeuwenhoekiella parthenopeia]
MKQIYLVLLVLIFTSAAFAQGTGSVVGVLSDKEMNNEPLPFATVQLKGTTKGTTTDFDGLYEIANVDAGTYTVVFSFVGYETVEIPNVVVEAGKVTTINTGLGATAAALDEVVITTTVSRESEVALLLEQKNATAIQQTIGADELARKGVSDAAAAIAKISGVSKQSGGSGNVYVRGLGDRYLNTTYNGLSLPSNDIERKNIDLDLFPSDIIQNVAVSKAYSTKFYGDFAASNVDVIAKDYKGKGFLDISLGSGINTRAAGKDFVRSEGTGYFGFYNRYDNNPFAVVLSQPVDPVDGGQPINLNGSISGGTSFDFGNETRLSVFATASFANDFEYRRGSKADFTSEYKQRFDDVEEFEYSTTTTAMANLIYRINSKHRISYNSLFLNSSSDEVGDYGVDGNGTNRDGIISIDEGFFVRNILFTQDMIFVNQLSGDHQFNDKLELSWGVGYNRVFARQPDRKRFTLENYQLALDNDPNTNPSFFNNTNFDNQRYFQDIQDEEINSRLNLEYKASEAIKLNFGYNGRTKTRDFKNIRYGYDLLEPRTEVSDINNLDGVFNLENLGTIYDTFVFRPLAPEYGIDNRNFPGNYENTYNGKLDIHAGYVNAEITTGKWLFVPGFRVESFRQSIAYDVINLGSNGIGESAAYKNFYLPSLNVKYAVNDDSNLRFSASKTVSFPEFKEVAPFVYEDVTQRVGGNPDLLNDPAVSNIYNLDLKYEWFFGKGELLSLSGFGKEINDPVNKVIANDATGTQRYFRTGDKATVYGVEFELRKNLLTNEDEQPVLAAGLNATVMKTEQKLKSSNGSFVSTLDRTDELQGASPYLINADLSYSPTLGSYKPVANLIYSYFDDRIEALGSGQLGNIIEKGVHNLDFVLRNELGNNWELNLSAKNLLDPDIQYFRAEPTGDIVISNYKRGIDLGLSVKYSF